MYENLNGSSHLALLLISALQNWAGLFFDRVVAAKSKIGITIGFVRIQQLDINGFDSDPHKTAGNEADLDHVTASVQSLSQPIFDISAGGCSTL